MIRKSFGEMRKELADLHNKNVAEARAKRPTQRAMLSASMKSVFRAMRAMELRAEREAERRDIAFIPEADPLVRMFERRVKKVVDIYEKIRVGKWTETPPLSLLI